MKCCINLDWLMIHVHEPDGYPRDPEFFISRGYSVRVREYGTPQYRQMFTILQDGYEYIEVRRDPLSRRSDGGILDDDSVHLRLSNRTCYFADAIAQLRQFCVVNGFIYGNLTRIDICCDFNSFLYGDNPRNFILDYMKNVYTKTRITHIAAYGMDSDSCRIWNSISWASKSSAVRTKLYNKTVELREKGDKPYIRDHWRAAGLDLNKDVWRVEFSISSQMNSLRNRQTNEVYKLDMNSYETVQQRWYLFHCLAQQYFHFKVVEYSADGTMIRKARLKDKVLFSFKDCPSYVMPAHFSDNRDINRTDMMMIHRLEKIAEDSEIDPAMRLSAANIIEVLYSTVERQKWLGRPLSDAERKQFFPKLHKWFSEDDINSIERRKVIREMINEYVRNQLWEELPF